MSDQMSEKSVTFALIPIIPRKKSFTKSIKKVLDNLDTS